MAWTSWLTPASCGVLASSLRMTMDTYTSIMPSLDEAAAEASVSLVTKALEEIQKARQKKQGNEAEGSPPIGDDGDGGSEQAVA